MRVIITGGTGLIGRKTAEFLAIAGHEIIILTRDAGRAGALPPGVRAHEWDARTGEGWAQLITPGCAVVNLAGENPAHLRWTKKHKKRVLESRLDAAGAVLDAVRQAGRPPRLLLQASAVGYYGDRGDEFLPETAPAGAGWLADVCRAWERVAVAVPGRQVLLRIGIVLSRDGGALPPLLRASRLYAKCLGKGGQWIPWVHEHDVASAVRFLLLADGVSGAFNLVAPEPATNAEFMRELADARRKRAFLPVPRFALRLALGEMAGTVLDSQRVVPKKLVDAGFAFRFPDLESALKNLVR